MAREKVRVRLYGPGSFWRSAPEVIEARTNGCGPQGWKVDMIPDKILGLDVSYVCRIHDWMYGEGDSVSEKEMADRAFLNNLCRVIDAKTRFRTLRVARKILAWVYYEFVRKFGGPAFWKGKNLPEEMGEVEI